MIYTVYIYCVYIHEESTFIFSNGQGFLPPFTAKDTNDDRRPSDAAMQLFVAMQQPPELNAESGAPGKTRVACDSEKRKKNDAKNFG